MKTSIVTDSTADVPTDLAERYSIHTVRNFMIVDGQSLEDGVDITREQFYAHLPMMKTNPTTATAAPGVYKDLYDRLLTQGTEQIISIHASSKLSGILNSVSSAVESFPGRVHIFDSLSISLGLGLQVLIAAEAAVQGVAPEAIRAMLESARPRTRVIALLDTLDNAVRSGRVSWAKGQLGNLLRIKPFVEIKDGVVNSIGEVRTRSKGIARLHELLHQLGPIERLGLLHANAEADALTFQSELYSPDTAAGSGLPARESVPMVNITPIIGAHTGPGALGFAVILK